jgi:hypothetical protein
MAAFTTIATGVGLATTAGSTFMSFKQANDARDAQQKAEEKAGELLADARKKLGVNVFDATSLPKEPYMTAFQQGQVAAQAGIEAGQQGDPRGVGATVGRTLMAQQQANQQTRADMSKELYNIQATQLEEDARLRDMQAQLDLQASQGASLAARDANAARNQALAQGMQGIASLGGQVASLAPLYEKTQGSRALGKALRRNDDLQAGLAGKGNLFGVNVSGVSDLSPMEFEDFMLNNFTPEQLKSIKLSKMGVPQQILQTPPSNSLDPFGVQVQGGENFTPDIYYNPYE